MTGAELAIASCEAQGVPVTIADPATLDRIAQLIAGVGTAVPSTPQTGERRDAA